MIGIPELPATSPVASIIPPSFLAAAALPSLLRPGIALYRFPHVWLIISIAKDLKANDRIIKCNFPVIDGPEKMLYPYTHGFFCGDGTYNNISENNEHSCKFKSLDGHNFCKRHIDFETENYLKNLIVKDNLLDTLQLEFVIRNYKPKNYFHYEYFA
jgi:hypothetical protein